MSNTAALESLALRTTEEEFAGITDRLMAEFWRRAAQIGPQGALEEAMEINRGCATLIVELLEQLAERR